MDETVSNKLKEVAIGFFFPHIAMEDIAYRRISNFIDSEFKQFGACVMYRLNLEFMELATHLGLEDLVAEKEVIIKSHHILASENCENYLGQIYSC